MTIDEAVTRYKNNAEYERAHGNLQGCLEFKQLAEWLKQLQKIRKIIDDWENSGEEDDPVNIIINIEEVVEDGNYNRH